VSVTLNPKLTSHPSLHTPPVYSGDVAALIRSHMKGLLSFERTMEQTTETMPLAARSPKTITAANNEENYKLTRAATLLVYFSSALRLSLPMGLLIQGGHPVS